MLRHNRCHRPEDGEDGVEEEEAVAAPGGQEQICFSCLGLLLPGRLLLIMVVVDMGGMGVVVVGVVRTKGG